MNKTKNEVIRVIPLGGVGEIGKSMYVIEIDDELFVVDSGLMFPGGWRCRPSSARWWSSRQWHRDRPSGRAGSGRNPRPVFRVGHPR